MNSHFYLVSYYENDRFVFLKEKLLIIGLKSWAHILIIFFFVGASQ